MIEKIGGTGEKSYEDLPPGDPISSCGSTAKMERLLGVELGKMVGIFDGLSRTVDRVQ